MFWPYLTTTTKANWLRTVCPWCIPTHTLFTVCITWNAFIPVCERLTNITKNKNKPVYVEWNAKLRLNIFSSCFRIFSKLKKRKKLACFFFSPVGYQTFSYFNRSYAETPATCSLSKLCQKLKLWMLTALFLQQHRDPNLILNLRGEKQFSRLTQSQRVCGCFIVDTSPVTSVRRYNLDLIYFRALMAIFSFTFQKPFAHSP